MFRLLKLLCEKVIQFTDMDVLVWSCFRHHLCSAREKEKSILLLLLLIREQVMEYVSARVRVCV
jgi:hypothetical protein